MSQRLMNTDATEPTCGLSPRVDAPLDAAQVRLGRGQILLARKQQRHIDRHAREDGLLDRGQSFLGARES